MAHIGLTVSKIGRSQTLDAHTEIDCSSLDMQLTTIHVAYLSKLWPSTIRSDFRDPDQYLVSGIFPEFLAIAKY